MAQNWRGSN